MTQDYKTLRVPEDAYELARDAKLDDETWGEYLRRCSENPPTIREFVEVEDSPTVVGADVEFEPFDADVADELSKLRELVDDVPERTADQLEGRFR